MTEQKWIINGIEAPADADIYAEGYFRNTTVKVQGCCARWTPQLSKWEDGLCTLEECHVADDYQERPVFTESVTPVVTEEASDWTDKHYDNYYVLSQEDKQNGKIKVDAYFVSNMWKLGEKDNTGVLFHNLKTIARFGDKNSIEREIRALYGQTKRLAELHGIDL